MKPPEFGPKHYIFSSEKTLQHNTEVARSPPTPEGMIPTMTPRDTGDSVARGDAAVHQEKHSPDQDPDAKRKTGVSSCTAKLQEGFLETKDTEGRGNPEAIQAPLCNPITHSVHTTVQWDASVSVGPGLSLFSLQPTWSGDKGILLTVTKRFPVFVAQMTKHPQGAGWGLTACACAHPPRSAHHPLLPSRPRHAAGAEVQDHHRDDGRGAVGALLLPLRRLGDQLHSQGTAAALLALRGCLESTEGVHPESVSKYPLPKIPSLCLPFVCCTSASPNIASLHFPVSFCVETYMSSKEFPPKKIQ